MRGNPQQRYRSYTDLLDVLTQHQVTWCPWARAELDDYLIPITEEESDEWRSDAPLIYFHVIEMYYPIRVCRQFGRRQSCPPPLYSTSQALNKYDRRKRYKVKDWHVTHHQYIQL